MINYWSSEYWLDSSKVASAHFQKLFDLDLIKYNENILDLGCGLGENANLLSKKLTEGKVLGIDISDSMIDYAITHYQQSNSKLCFKHLDAMEMSFNSIFDRVFSFYCLHFIKDHRSLMHKIHTSLKPGGLINLYTVMDTKFFWEAVDNVSQMECWRIYLDDFVNPVSIVQEGEYKLSLEQAGFNEISCLIDFQVEVFETTNELIQCYKGFLPHLSLIPKELHAPFANDICKLFLKANGNLNKMEYTRIYMTACK